MKVALVQLTLVVSSLIGSGTDAAAPDSKKSLAGNSVPLRGPGFCIASDGGIWACRGDFGLERFDGEAWRDTNTFKRGGQLALDTDVKFRLTSYSLVPAQNGWVLTYVGHRVSDLQVESGMLLNHLFYPIFMMMNGQIGGGSPNFELWMASSRERFLEAFSQPPTNRAWFTQQAQIARKDKSGRVTIGAKALIRPGVVVDKKKNIWVTAGFTGAVFTKKAGISLQVPPDDTKPARSPEPKAEIDFCHLDGPGPRCPMSVSLAGDGEYVLLCLEDGNTYFASLTPKGEVDFQKGPKLSAYNSEHFEQWPLRDAQGGLWLTIDCGLHTTAVLGTYPPPSAAIVRRMSGPGKGEDFKGMGIPRIVDASGCVWLVPLGDCKKDVPSFWAPSGKTFPVKIPRRANTEFFVAGEKGHVFIETADGLQEFVANDPDAPTEYVPATLYHLEGLDGENVLDIQYSSLGYLAVVGRKKDCFGDGGCAMHLYPIGPTQSVRKVAPRAVAVDSSESKPAATTAKKKAPPVAARPVDVRTWQDATGQFSLKASFLRFGAGVVTLRKEDGSTLKVPMEKLSEEDQEYIRKRGR